MSKNYNLINNVKTFYGVYRKTATKVPLCRVLRSFEPALAGFVVPARFALTQGLSRHWTEVRHV